MEPHGRDDGRDRRLGLDAGSVVPAEVREHRRQADLVFDFSGLHSPDLTDLAMVLTARLSAGPGDRVWVRALPLRTWRLLRALGLDHLFRIYPILEEELN